MSYAKRIDVNQPEIVKGLREYEGVSVKDIHALGKGIPDILVGVFGKNILFEIKSGVGELTPDEVEFYADWCGQVSVIRSVEDAVNYIEGHFGIRLFKYNLKTNLNGSRMKNIDRK